MIIFPSILADAAHKAGMKVPDDPEKDWASNEYPHFRAYCTFQLCRRITWGRHWFNAEIFAKIPEDQLESLTEDKLRILGFDP